MANTRKPTATKAAPKVEDAGASAPVTNAASSPQEGTKEAESAPTASVAGAFKLQSFTDLPPRNAGSNAQYPFREMAPGQMFFVPFEESENEAKRAQKGKRLSTAASQAGKAQDKRFAVRTTEEDGVAGVGVYCLRTEDAEEANA